MLGIGERTLYRVIQDWKAQDRLRQVLADAQGDSASAAKALGISESALARKLKKLGLNNPPA
jgi:DNA-binding NtrC family response regulator